MNKNQLIEITDILYEHGEIDSEVLQSVDDLIQREHWEEEIDGVLAERLLDEDVTMVDVNTAEEKVEYETAHYSGWAPLVLDRGELWFSEEQVGWVMHKPTDFEFEAPFPPDHDAVSKVETEVREANKRRGEPPAGELHWRNTRGV